MSTQATRTNSRLSITRMTISTACRIGYRQTWIVEMPESHESQPFGQAVPDRAECGSERLCACRKSVGRATRLPGRASPLPLHCRPIALAGRDSRPALPQIAKETSMGAHDEYGKQILRRATKGARN